jgi:hypothetical protein
VSFRKNVCKTVCAILQMAGGEEKKMRAEGGGKVRKMSFTDFDGKF